MVLKVRPYHKEDAAKIDEIYDRCHGHFSLPDIHHCQYLAVAEVDGEVVALGAFQLIPELVLVMDNQKPKKQQVVVLKELLKIGEELAKVEGYSDVYASPDSTGYREILKKHFGFKERDVMLIKPIGVTGEENGE